jgi:hypothetical protein
MSVRYKCNSRMSSKYTTLHNSLIRSNKTSQSYSRSPSLISKHPHCNFKPSSDAKPKPLVNCMHRSTRAINQYLNNHKHPSSMLVGSISRPFVWMNAASIEVLPIKSQHTRQSLNSALGSYTANTNLLNPTSTILDDSNAITLQDQFLGTNKLKSPNRPQLLAALLGSQALILWDVGKIVLRNVGSINRRGTFLLSNCQFHLWFLVGCCDIRRVGRCRDAPARRVGAGRDGANWCHGKNEDAVSVCNRVSNCRLSMVERGRCEAASVRIRVSNYKLSIDERESAKRRLCICVFVLL